mmetsp:Transcript_23705/g.11411  ORF Transcript_23705/g.11411 Transcript_23705/m.11411 type:complete len:175 (+) Transcript_23705:786-1310(+)
MRIIDKIKIIQGDITKLKTDAIVNAANKSLLGGGGVDGAIHHAAGSLLLDECRKIGGCNTGEARITKGYNLDAKYIIHTVGPIYSNKKKDSILLGYCYNNCLHLAVQNNIKTIAFPAISCGVYGYPIKEACHIAIDTTCNSLKTDSYIEKIIFVLFSSKHYEVYVEYLRFKDCA